MDEPASPASIATAPTPWPRPSPRRRQPSQGSPPPRWHPAHARVRQTRKERKAERTQGKARKGGLPVRVLAIAIPVAAFAAAFILGAGSRAHDPPPARLATGSAQHGSATVASMATVPAPAKLVVVHHPAKKTKSKPAHKAADVHAHSTATSAPSSSTPPASRSARRPRTRR